jgi:sensor histidine kinase YesM
MTMKQYQWWVGYLPVFGIIALVYPMILILLYRYIKQEFLTMGLVHAGITMTGFLLNDFASRQIRQRSLVILLSFFLGLGTGSAILTHLLVTRPVILIFGLDTLGSYVGIASLFNAALYLLSSGYVLSQQQADEEKSLRERMEQKLHASQINPHFLFNSLNLLVSVLDDRDRAEDLLIRLSSLLRYNVEAVRKERISLASELENTAQYLYIQKARFGDRLDYRLDNSTEGFVPPLILQPLVENSIKHNIQERFPLKLEVEVSRQDRRILIRVADSARLLTPDMPGQGTGLDVTRRRVLLAGGTFLIRNGEIMMEIPG